MPPSTRARKDVTKQRIKGGLVALVLSVSLAGPAAAGQLEDGDHRRRARRLRHGAALLRPLADRG